jgi:hypothetical protein
MWLMQSRSTAKLEFSMPCLRSSMSIGIRAFWRLGACHPWENKEVLEASVLRMRNIFYSASFNNGAAVTHPWQSIIHVCGHGCTFSADHIGHQAMTTQFTNGVRSSKESSYIQSLLRNTPSDYALSIFQHLMSWV